MKKIIVVTKIIIVIIILLIQSMSAALADDSTSEKECKELIAFSDAKYNIVDRLETYILDKGSDVDCQTKHGETPLIYACRRDNERVAIFLIEEQRVNTDLQDRHGNTALFYAVKKNNFKIMKSLVDARARLNIENNKEETAIMTTKNNDVINFLTEYGAWK